jgi:hypothetical protein
MKINTTHNVKDKVFYIKNKTIKKAIIVEININVNNGGPLERYYLNEGGEFYSFELFKTERAAKKKLKEIYE